MDNKISQQDIIKKIAVKHSMNVEDTEAFIEGFFNLIEKSLVSDSVVKIKGLGMFKLVDVDSRESINVNTGERIEIKGHSKITFTPDPAMKEHINKPFSQFETIILNKNTTFDDMNEISEEKEVTENSSIDSADIDLNLISKDETDNISTGEEEKIAEVVENKNTSTENSNDRKDNIEEVNIVGNEQKNDKSQENENIYEDDALIVENESDVINENIVIPPTEKNGKTSGVFEIMPDKQSKLEDKKMKKSNKKSLYIAIVACIIVVIVAAISIIAIISSSLFEQKSDFLLPKGKHKEATIPLVREELHVDDSLEERIAEEESDFKTTESDTQDSSTLKKKEIVNDGKIKEEVVAQNSKPVKEEIVELSSKSVSNPSRYDENKSYKITALKCNHKVKAGESLRIISLKYYGTKKFWHYILTYNQKNVPDMNFIQPGMNIKIPELKSIQ